MATTLSSFLKPLNLDPAKLTNLTLEFRKTFEELAFDSSQQFLPTPITLPEHIQEFNGLVLAIDVGGSHLRVGLFGGAGEAEISLVDGGDYKVIPEDIKAGTAEGLFSFIGKHVVSVLQSYEDGVSHNGGEPTDTNDGSAKDRLGSSLPVGVTFSFPMIQHSIGEATLMPLGKGFTMKPGQKLDELLLAGYEEHARGIPTSINRTDGCTNGNGHHRNCGEVLPRLTIKAITNDTIATLIAGRHFSSPDDYKSLQPKTTNQDTILGLILATGMNATIALPYFALLSTKTSSPILPSTKTTSETKQRILVNTELSIRGTSPPLQTLNIITPWDTVLDKSTASPGFQPLEYLTSGRYLGELVRLIFIDWLVNVQNFSLQSLPPRLLRPWILTTEYLSTVVAVSNSSRKLAERLTQDFPSTTPSTANAFTWSPQQTETLSTIAQQVQIRSSRLIGAACIALLLLSGDIQLKARQSPQSSNIKPNRSSKESKEIAIAYTGAVIEKYPMYLATCQETIDALFYSLCNNDDGVERIVMNKVMEGGLKGAALLAVGELVKEERQM